MYDPLPVSLWSGFFLIDDDVDDVDVDVDERIGAKKNIKPILYYLFIDLIFYYSQRWIV